MPEHNEAIPQLASAVRLIAVAPDERVAGVVVGPGQLVHIVVWARSAGGESRQIFERTLEGGEWAEFVWRNDTGERITLSTSVVFPVDQDGEPGVPVGVAVEKTVETVTGGESVGKLTLWGARGDDAAVGVARTDIRAAGATSDPEGSRGTVLAVPSGSTARFLVAFLNDAVRLHFTPTAAGESMGDRTIPIEGDGTQVAEEFVIENDSDDDWEIVVEGTRVVPDGTELPVIVRAHNFGFNAAAFALTTGPKPQRATNCVCLIFAFGE